MQLIDDWRNAWRLWSVRWAAALAMLPEILYQLAVALGDVMPALAGVVVQNLPPWLRGTLAVAGVIGVAARLVRQNVAQRGPAA